MASSFASISVLEIKFIRGNGPCNNLQASSRWSADLGWNNQKQNPRMGFLFLFNISRLIGYYGASKGEEI
jgi:hypothetical protein